METHGKKKFKYDIVADQILNEIKTRFSWDVLSASAAALPLSVPAPGYTD